MPKPTTLILALVAAAVAAVAVAYAYSPAALADEPAVTLSIPPHDYDVQLGGEVLPEPVRTVEILAALETWTNVGQWNVVPEETLRPWAQAIADVCTSRWDCIWIASQASVESRFARSVLDYSCNAQLPGVAKRAHASDIGEGRYLPGSCDSGWAVGPWQMHDLRMIGASPAVQAARAAQWMRTRPMAWTTWREARAQALAWIQGR